MSAPSDPRTLVLHGLRIKGVVEADAVADAVELPLATTCTELDELVRTGLVVHRSGALTGFTLTREGREEHARVVALEVDQAHVRDGLGAAYERFAVLNPQLLTLCTDWQLREERGEPVRNDHSDLAYDAAVIERLESLHGQALPICHDLAALLARYRPYGAHLDHAVERVRAGDLDWFTKPMIASYHTVWFELHEDLLVTLGITRGAEVPA